MGQVLSVSVLSPASKGIGNAVRPKIRTSGLLAGGMTLPGQSGSHGLYA